MGDHDSDSSDAELCDYMETNVLLGFASKEPNDDTISHLGGRPDWLDLNMPPSAALARCRHCKDLMVLLLQLNGNLPTTFPGHERRVYIFVCRHRSCGRKDGSVRALRGVRTTAAGIEAARQEPVIDTCQTDSIGASNVPQRNYGDALFKPSIGAFSPLRNPFSTNRSSTPSTKDSDIAGAPSQPPNAQGPYESHASPIKIHLEATVQLPTRHDPTEPLQSFTSALSLHSPQFSDDSQSLPKVLPEPWPSDNEAPRPFPLLYLTDADYEQLDAPLSLPTPSQTLGLDDDTTPGHSASLAEDKAIFESTIDSTFQKFADRLAQNPEQVIRYEFRGMPLLYSKSDTVAKMFARGVEPDPTENIMISALAPASRLPLCTNCGGKRVFEVQLVPHAIALLEENELSLEGMDWGTIVVGVCDMDCSPKDVKPGEAGYVEEWAGVQWEELSTKSNS